MGRLTIVQGPGMAPILAPILLLLSFTQTHTFEFQFDKILNSSDVNTEKAAATETDSGDSITSNSERKTVFNTFDTATTTSSVTPFVNFFSSSISSTPSSVVFDSFKKNVESSVNVTKDVPIITEDTKEKSDAAPEVRSGHGHGGLVSHGGGYGDHGGHGDGYGGGQGGHGHGGGGHKGGLVAYGGHAGYKVVQPKHPGPYGPPTPNFKCDKGSESLYVTKSSYTTKKKCFHVFKVECSETYAEGKDIGSKKHCNEFTQTKCRTVYDTSSEQKCTHVYKKHCEEVYETVTDWEYEQKCSTSYEKLCHGYGYHQHCDKVPKEHCQQVPKKVHKTVPRTKCKDVPDKKCQDFPIQIPRKECREFPQTVCTEDPVQVKKKIPKRICEAIPIEKCVTIPVQIIKDVPKTIGKKVCHSTKPKHGSYHDHGHHAAPVYHELDHGGGGYGGGHRKVDTVIADKKDSNFETKTTGTGTGSSSYSSGSGSTFTAFQKTDFSSTAPSYSSTEDDYVLPVINYDAPESDYTADHTFSPPEFGKSALSVGIAPSDHIADHWDLGPGR